MNVNPRIADRRCPVRLLPVGIVLAVLVGCTSSPDELAGTTAPDASPSASRSTPPVPAMPAATFGSGAAAPGTGTGTGGGSGAPFEVGPAAVPAHVMLRAGDWPRGKVLREAGAGPETLAQTEPSACQQRTAFPSDRYRLSVRSVSIVSAAPLSGGLHEVEVRYAPGRAAQAMTEFRRALASCDRYRLTEPGPDWTRSYRLETERFTGDDALLVRRSERLDGTTQDWSSAISVVQVGDAVITTTSGLGEGTADFAVADGRLRVQRLGPGLDVLADPAEHRAGGDAGGP